MESTANVLTTAGMVKIPFGVSSGLEKIRLYFFLNQQPADIAKIQTLFELEMKGNAYKGEIFQIFETIQTTPYLLKQGKIFRLISLKNVFELEEKLLKVNQEIIRFYQNILKISLKNKNHINEQIIYLKLVDAFYELKDFRNVITYQEKALKIALKMKDVTIERGAYCNLGAAYSALGDYRSAIKYQEKALKIALELKDVAIKGKAYGNLGNAYHGLGDYTRAITYHRKHLKIALELKDWIDEGKAYSNLGAAYQKLGDYRGAITYHEKGLKIALKLNHLASEGKIYADLGNAYEGLGKYEDAITYHEKALKLALELKDGVSEGKIYAGLGNAYSGHGDYRSAITYHEKALKLTLKLKDLVIEGKVYGNLGNAYQGLGDYKSAITYQEKHLKIALKLNDWADIKNAHGNLGNAYNGLGDYKGAIAYYEKHLKIALELKDLASEGRAYCNLGSAYSGLGDYKGAIAYYERHLKIALELNDRVSEGRIYGNLGSAYDGLEDYKGAITYQKKALEIALKQKDLVGEGHTYGNLGNTYLKLREENKAERYFQQSIKILASFHHQIQDPKWQISFFEEQSFSYIGLEKALLGQNKLDQALEASDMRRARALSSLISRHPSSAAHQKTSLGTLTIQTIRDLAKKFHTTFIMYSSSSGNQSNPSLQAWVISSESEKVSSVSFSISDQIFLNPEQIFNAFPYLKETKRPQRREKQPGEAFKEKLSSFYTCLIAPLEQYLPLKDSGETLTFILDGFLAHLPFGAFYNKDEDKYLIENYPISVAPSIEALYLLDELPKNSSQEALLMGNPTTPKKELNELKLAEKEVCIIVAPMLGLSQDEVFIQEKATPMCVVDKAPHARIIHIACHGVIYQKLFEKHDPNSVFEGLFKLAPDEKHSMGHLHAKEIAEMSLKADLVFMSACHLGRGNLKEEGSVGPVWSFLGAGAKSTIASYWPLPEGDMTVKMVETFYKHYLGINTPKLNKSKALQQAILMAMKIDRDKPRQWGAFFLSGIIE